MKYLNHYIEDMQTAAFRQYGAFFAFSPGQFEEQRNPAVKKYSSLGSGMFCPSKNAEALIGRLDAIVQQGIVQDPSQARDFVTPSDHE